MGLLGLLTPLRWYICLSYCLHYRGSGFSAPERSWPRGTAVAQTLTPSCSCNSKHLFYLQGMTSEGPTQVDKCTVGTCSEANGAEVWFIKQKKWQQQQQRKKNSPLCVNSQKPPWELKHVILTAGWVSQSLLQRCHIQNGMVHLWGWQGREQKTS